MTFYKWLQERLAAHGVSPGPIDGIWGRRSMAALEAFQRKAGLPVSHVADNATVAALRLAETSRAEPADPAPEAPDEPIWVTEARRFLGIHEIAGARSNATILGFARKLGGWVAGWYKNDDTPWCGLFVANAIATTLPHEALPSNPLSARAWGTFGRGMKHGAAGTILVFSRTGGGHVGFYVGEDADAYHVLGGNQSNSVTITRVSKARCIGIRWPLSGGAPSGGRIWMSVSGTPISTQEA